MTKITIEIYSDTLCPFCYIGKKSLDAAISSYQSSSSFPSPSSHPAEPVEFSLVWRPFLIHPKFRGRVPDKRTYFRAKYGAQTDTFFRKLEDRGKALGIDFHWDGASGSSWDSHKLILHAASADSREGGKRQEEFLERLFRGVFEEGQDVSDREFLARLAVESGVTGSVGEAMGVMEDEEMGRRVERESERARRREIEAVPSYVVQGRYFVGGMQAPEVFEEVFRRAAGKGEEGDARVEAREGEACYPPGK